ncbi:hypothetical protein BDA99DRAFT_520208 [Phascolomyces articulosus]|uniref:Uncharacterized protein n=1 Tax=Phascolomyces articulosus TaxID=60185 RepID=A0AAD5K308_9FUNG|nr:hypothetical protein BDA99DRAFT_520208 [Phascolomyces articulosus]
MVQGFSLQAFFLLAVALSVMLISSQVSADGILVEPQCIPDGQECKPVSRTTDECCPFFWCAPTKGDKRVCTQRPHNPPADNPGMVLY